MKGIGRLSLCYAAGSLAGVIAALLFWLSAELGLLKHYHVDLHPRLELPWIYEKAVWGGLWGFLFALPLFPKAPWPIQGILFSIPPLLAEYFVIFPLVNQQGLLGLALGEKTPVFIAAFTILWGLITAWWLRLMR